MSSTFRQQARFALSGLRARNAQFEFEHLCRALARVTVAPNIVPATGPVSAGGDQGRDFETYGSVVARPGPVGASYGVGVGDPVAFVCTLQQDRVGAKVLSDARRALEGRSFALVVAYVEADVPVAARHDLETRAERELGMTLALFDGTAIAEELTFHRDILREPIDRFLAVGEPTAEVVPRRVPTAPLNFVNRGVELAALDVVLEEAATAPGPRVAVLAGMHGVGKSAVATQWANGVRDRFPDGDLFVDFTPPPGAVAGDPGDALATLLRDLGAGDGGIPESVEDRRRVFADLTASRRLLLVVDNAEYPAQVLATMPVGRGSVVVVASARRLDELVFEGATLVEVEPLGQEEAHELLVSLAGVERVETDRSAMSELIELCGGLPVALAVVGSSMRLEPSVTMASMVKRIRDAEDRLAALSGPGRFATSSIFEMAYDALPADVAATYLTLGWWAQSEVSVPLIAALGSVTIDVARRRLDELADRYLVDRLGDDRYGVHTLVAAHMAAVAGRDDTGDARRDGLGGAVEWAYAAVAAADQAIVVDRLRLGGTPPSDVEGVPALASASEAYAWFARERHSVMAAMTAGAELGRWERVWQLSEGLWPLCATQKWFGDWVRSQQLGVEAGVALGERRVEARMRSQLARAHAELGDHADAAAEMAAALDAVATVNDPRLAASIQEFDGVVRLAIGDYAGAVAVLELASSAMAAIGSTRGAALAMYYAAVGHVGQGDGTTALALLDRAGPDLLATGDEISFGRCEIRRAEALMAEGRLSEARDAAAAAIPVLEGLALRFELAEANEVLAQASAGIGDDLEARRARQSAYRLLRELGHPRAEELERQLGSAS